MNNMLGATALLVIGTLTASTGLAQNPIYTGGERGSYFNAFGPRIQAILADNFLDFDVVTSAGSAANVEKVAGDPLAIGLSQSDVLAFMALTDPDLLNRVTIVRNDIADECLYAVATADNADRLENWGGVRGLARRLTIATGPEGSGSAMTFRYLQSIDDQLSEARNVVNAENTDSALEMVISGEAQIAFFVQFADTSNARFEQINDAELVFLPVIDRNLLRQQVDGQSIYNAQQVKVTSASLLSWRGVTEIVTACTPLAYVAGDPEALSPGSNDRLDLEDTIQILRDADLADLQPDEGWFRSMLDDVVVVTGEGLDATLDAVDDATQRVLQ